MHRIFPILTMMFLACPQFVFAQKIKTDANIIGHVTSKGEHIISASIAVAGTTIGTITDQTGHFQLINLPVGELIIVVRMIGYQTQSKTVITEQSKTTEIKFDLAEDVLNLAEVVVSADRSQQKRIEAPVMVSTITPKLFNTINSVTLSEGLNFSPGLRIENNCQNCGFTQVRINGMEGPYSQILINSRPVFSGLVSVYGLELIPSSMLERVEVIRGGGSSLYGSNAIAGTINLILKDPVAKSFEFGTNYSLTGVGSGYPGGSSPDYSFNANTTVVSDDHKTGIAVFGFARERKMFDANNDEFSEIAPMNNLTFGTRFFHRPGYRNKLILDLFAITESRDGGNRQDYPLHERDIGESVKHDLKTGAVTFEQYFREYDLFSVYASGQWLNRESYYGANRSLKDYGNSKDKTYNFGAQYKVILDHSSINMGIENTGSFLSDAKLGFPDFENATIVDDSITEIPHTSNVLIADQSSVISAVFAQYEANLDKLKVAVGGRYNYYSVKDLGKEVADTKSDFVFSPRVSLMYEIITEIQARLSYSQGFRAPQIFDEDLHIETSGSRQVIIVNDPQLKQETSHSIMLSFDYNGMIKSVNSGFLVEGFYTRLMDPFTNQIGTPDENGRVIYTRKNASDGALVKGVNMEFKLGYLRTFSLTSGFTLQSSTFDVPQEFNEKRFFRTPDQYGYFVLDWDYIKNICLSASGNYTGKMLIPYFGPETDPNTGELRTSDPFFDLGAKLQYDMKINGANLQWSCGIKNIFNSYQSDFDTGINRSPSYIYGPVSPRTIYLGLKIGSFLD